LMEIKGVSYAPLLNHKSRRESMLCGDKKKQVLRLAFLCESVSKRSSIKVSRGAVPFVEWRVILAYFFELSKTRFPIKRR
jgi:hypothetical protein